MSRLRHLNETLGRMHCQTIIEVGTFSGHNACRLAKAAFRRNRSVCYHGFDLFASCRPEDLNPGSTRQPQTGAEVAARLRSFGEEVGRRPLWLRREFRFELHQGYTEETLPAFRAASPEARADFIFIDGGHQVETIAHDWRWCSEMLAPGGVIFLDDYYDAADPATLAEFGCNQLVETLRQTPEWEVAVQPTADLNKKGRGIRVVKVQKRA